MISMVNMCVFYNLQKVKMATGFLLEVMVAQFCVLKPLSRTLQVGALDGMWMVSLK